MINLLSALLECDAPAEKIDAWVESQTHCTIIPGYRIGPFLYEFEMAFPEVPLNSFYNAFITKFGG